MPYAALSLQEKSRFPKDSFFFEFEHILFFLIYFIIVPYLSYAFSDVVTLLSSDNKKIGFFFVFLLWNSVKRFPFHSWEPCPITQLKLNLVEREWELLSGSGWKSLLSGSAPMFSTNTLQGKEEL